MNGLIGPSVGAGLFFLDPSAAIFTQAVLLSLSTALLFRLRSGGATSPHWSSRLSSIGTP